MRVVGNGFFGAGAPDRVVAEGRVATNLNQKRRGAPGSGLPGLEVRFQIEIEIEIEIEIGIAIEIESSGALEDVALRCRNNPQPAESISIAISIPMKQRRNKPALRKQPPDPWLSRTEGRRPGGIR